MHKVLHMINFASFAVELGCLHQDAQERLISTNQHKNCVRTLPWKYRRYGCFWAVQLAVVKQRYLIAISQLSLCVTNWFLNILEQTTWPCGWWLQSYGALNVVHFFLGHPVYIQHYTCIMVIVIFLLSHYGVAVWINVLFLFLLWVTGSEVWKLEFNNVRTSTFSADSKFDE